MLTALVASLATLAPAHADHQFICMSFANAEEETVEEYLERVDPQRFGSSFVEEALRRELGFISSQAQISTPALYWIDDMNACAIDGKGIYFGKPFYEEMVQQFGPVEALRVAGYVLCHEFAHHMQFKFYRSRFSDFESVNRELQADMLSGIWMGYRIGENVAEWSAFVQAQREAFQIGDFVNSHGTPLQRARAVTFGIEAGRGLRRGERGYFTPDGTNRPAMVWTEKQVKVVLQMGR